SIPSSNRIGDPVRPRVSPLAGVDSWLLRPLGSVLGTPLPAIGHTARIQGAANDVVTHARQVLHASTANEHDRVLLEVVTLARDVRGDLVLVRQPNARDLAQRGVRLLRRRRVDARAHTTLLRIRL